MGKLHEQYESEKGGKDFKAQAKRTYEHNKALFKGLAWCVAFAVTLRVTANYMQRDL